MNTHTFMQISSKILEGSENQLMCGNKSRTSWILDENITLLNCNESRYQLENEINLQVNESFHFQEVYFPEHLLSRFRSSF